MEKKYKITDRNITIDDMVYAIVDGELRLARISAINEFDDTVEVWFNESDRVDEDTIDTVDIINLDSIPLTGDILLKAGWTIKSDDRDKTHYYIRVTPKENHDLDTGIDLIWDSNDYRLYIGTLYDGFNWFPAYIYGVHQLQNVLRSLNLNQQAENLSRFKIFEK